MTTALARYDAGLTVGDWLTIELPHLSPEERVHVLWEYTGWPCFWPSDDHPLIHIRRQLRDFKSGHGETLTPEG